MMQRSRAGSVALLPPGWSAGQPLAAAGAAPPGSPSMGHHLVPAAPVPAPGQATPAWPMPVQVSHLPPPNSPAAPGPQQGQGQSHTLTIPVPITISGAASPAAPPVGGASPVRLRQQQPPAGGASPVRLQPQQQRQKQHPVTPKRCGSGDSVSTRASAGSEEDDLSEEMLEICRKIDADGNGSISEVELIGAVRSFPDVAAFVLPGVDPATLLEDERAFDLVDETFEQIAKGKQRVRYWDFVNHFKRTAAERTSNARELQALYQLIDADGSGSVSKLELVDAVQSNPEVAALVLPGKSAGGVLNDEDAFDVVKGVFDRVAGGKKRFSYEDFEAHFRRVESTEAVPERPVVDRAARRVLIIGPGFGRQMNPRQGALIEEVGFQTRWVWEGLPNPEQPNFDTRPYLEKIKAELEDFEPDIVAAASKGGAYVAGLWAHGLWRGPTLLINAHPSCARLPAGVPVVVCQGSNDEVYPTPRAKLEEMIATGTPNMSFLYYTANSGKLPSGHFSRVGDQHNMQSILQHDCLPRLLDAALAAAGPPGAFFPAGPELHFVRSWRDRLTEDRLRAENWLGYTPDMLRKKWSSPSHRGCDDQKLFEVLRGSEEFQQVAAVCKAQPKEPPAYLLSPPETWDRVQIVKVERIENGALHDGCTVPYYTTLRRSLEDQGVAFEPGTHTSWAFHGADAEAIDSIVSSPVAGFQPLASGSRGASLWGSGTYFARDAKYVADGGFCGQPGPGGTRRMLMCLLMTGMPCLGDPQHKGVLPFRNKPHRYNCTVDCLSSPEVYIMQHSGAAHAAYLITFA